MAAEVWIRLLGRMSIEHGQRQLDARALPGHQGRLALAYLSLTHHPVARDELADVIWAEHLPASWERDLSVVISKIRTTLTSVGLGSILQSGLGCYELQLSGEARVDVEEAFRLLEEAEAAWRRDDRLSAIPAADTAANLARRPFLPGERGLWVERRRSELRSTLVRSLELLIEGQAERGYQQDALRFANELVSLEPYHETAYVRLMRLQIAVGNRAEAIRTYERCRRLLADELGVQPSREVEAAHREALAGAPSTA